jgi:L-fuconolactonase
VDAGAALIDRYPDTRFIIDHLAIIQPRTPPAPPQPWADLPKVLDLARRPNAVIKVSGACTLSREPYPFPDIWDPLARVFDAWGFERCLWGTDWTLVAKQLVHVGDGLHREPPCLSAKMFAVVGAQRSTEGRRP